MWYHLVDQHGNHYVLNPSAQFFFSSTAVDGSAPILMSFPLLSLRFIVTAAQFTAIVGALPAANIVQVPS